MYNKALEKIYSYQDLAIDGVENWLKQNWAFLGSFYDAEEAPLLSYDKTDPSMAVLDMSGIVGYNLTNEKLETALETISANPGIQRIFMNISSPGGVAIEAFEMDDTLKAWKEKNNIPITAYTSDVAASAGYLLGCRADKFYASRGSKVGSIGVMKKVINEEKALAKSGYEVITFRSGKLKDVPNGMESIPKEVKEKIQAQIDKMGSEFFSRVAECRRKKPITIKEMEGEAFYAEDGYKKGLIDGIVNKKGIKRAIYDTSVRAELESEEQGDEGIKINNVTNINSKPLNTETKMPTEEKNIQGNQDQLNEAEALKQELALLKEDKVNEYQALYTKATGKQCPISKINSLRASGVSDIKAEISIIQSTIDAKISSQEVVKESVIKEGSVAESPVPSTENKNKQKSETLALLNYMARTARNKRPDFNYDIAKDSVLSAYEGGSY